MNKTLALFAIVIVTIAIFFIGVGVDECADKSHQFDKYDTTSENEDIRLNVQVAESMLTKTEAGGDYQKENYDVYFIVTKNNSNDIVTNLYAYMCVESGGEYQYLQTPSARSISSGSSYIYWRNTTMSFTNSSTAFAYKKIDTTNDKIKVIDKTPDYIYVRITYNIEKEAKPGEIVPKELTYKFKYSDLNKKKFNNYESRELVLDKIDSKDDAVELKFIYSDQYEPYGSEYTSRLTLDSVNVLLDKVPEGDKVKGLYLDIDGELEKVEEPSDKYFDKYLHLFKYSGTINTNKPGLTIDVPRYAYMPEQNNLKTLYISCELRLESGKTLTYNYKVDASVLPRA